MNTESAGTDAGINESGSAKDQLDELSKFANSSGEDFVPAGGGVDAGGQGRASGVDNGAMLAGLLGTVSIVVATRRGDHWKLSDDEAKALGGALDAVVQKYIPDMESSPEFALVAVSLAVIGPRVMADMQMQNAANDEGKDGDKSESKSA